MSLLPSDVSRKLFRGLLTFDVANFFLPAINEGHRGETLSPQRQQTADIRDICHHSRDSSDSVTVWKTSITFHVDLSS